ncbi:SH3 domain-containing protein [Pseudarcicella hirudinis]
MKFKVLLIITLTVFCHFISNAQKTNYSMNGIWEYVDNRSEESFSTSQKSWRIVFEDTTLIVTLFKDRINGVILLLKSGFQNKKKSEIDSLNVSVLANVGAYYTEVFGDEIHKNNFVKKYSIMTYDYLYFDDTNLEMDGGKLAIFNKVNIVPREVYLFLLKKGIEDKKNYTKYLLKSNCYRVIYSLKSIIHFTPNNKQSQQYLLKGDEVEILEEKLVKGTSWLKIRYYGGKTIEGWIKKTDVE